MAAGPQDDERPEEPPAPEPGPDGSEGADGRAPDASPDPSRSSEPPLGGSEPGVPAPGADDPSQDVDARWLEIVSQLEDLGHLTGQEPRDGAAGRPRGERRSRDQDRPDGAPQEREVPSRPDEVRIVRPAASQGPQGPRTWSPDPEVEEAEDHFEPPDPDPVLSGDPMLTMAWAAVIGLPLLLVVAVVIWHDVPALVMAGAALAFVVGLGLLLWRMPDHHDDDRGPGAVV